MRNQNALRLNAPVSSQAKFQLAIDSFFDRCEALNLSAGTLRFYRDKLAVFARYLERQHIDPTLADLNTALIRDFVKKEVTRSSAQSAKHCFTTMRALCNHLVNDGWLDVSPMKGVDAPKVPRKIIPTYSEEQLQVLLATCDDTFIGLRDRAMLLLLVDCGLRANELLSLRAPDIDMHASTFVVMGKGAKEREIPFGQAAKTALRDYLRRVEGVDAPTLFIGVLGEALTYSGLVQTLRKRGTTAKLPKALLHPHVFRHTFAVMYLRNGGDVFSLQKLLGHTDLTMTRRYAELSQSDVVEKHRQFSPADALPVPQMGGRKRMR